MNEYVMSQGFGHAYKRRVPRTHMPEHQQMTVHAYKSFGHLIGKRLFTTLCREIVTYVPYGLVYGP